MARVAFVPELGVACPAVGRGEDGGPPDPRPRVAAGIDGGRARRSDRPPRDAPQGGRRGPRGRGPRRGLTPARPAQRRLPSPRRRGSERLPPSPLARDVPRTDLDDDPFVTGLAPRIVLADVLARHLVDEG